MRTRCFLGLVALLGAAGLVLDAAGSSTTPGSVGEPSLEGTWRLVSRDLPDGKKQVPPEIVGLMTFANGYRNFNIYWRGEGGKPVSISKIAKVEISQRSYREENVYYMILDSVDGSGAIYDVSKQSGESEVREVGGAFEFDLPLHGEPKVTLEGDRFTATREGAFVDHWERVR